MHKLHIYKNTFFWKKLIISNFLFKKNENKTPTGADREDNVKVPASRVCYLDEGSTNSNLKNYEKGNLGLWTSDNPGYNFDSKWFRSNLELWNYFRNKYPTESPLDKFDEWYQTQTKN